MDIEKMTGRADVVLLEIKDTLEAMGLYLSEYLALPVMLTGSEKIEAATSALLDVTEAIECLNKVLPCPKK